MLWFLARRNAELAALREQLERLTEQMELARRMLREAETVEELDLARSELQRAQAELQFLIRSAKAARGRPLLPVAVTEEIYQRLCEQCHGGRPISAEERERWFGYAA